MKKDPAPMLGDDLYKVLYGATFKFDKKQSALEIYAICDKIEKEYEEGNHLEKRPKSSSPVPLSAAGPQRLSRPLKTMAEWSVC